MALTFDVPSRSTWPATAVGGATMTLGIPGLRAATIVGLGRLVSPQ